MVEAWVSCSYGCWLQVSEGSALHVDGVDNEIAEQRSTIRGGFSVYL